MAKQSSTSTSGSKRATRRSSTKSANTAAAAEASESVNVEITDDPAPVSRRTRADKLIEKQMLWSLGAGVIPIPLVDLGAVAAVQVSLVRALSELYGTSFSEDRTKKIISVLTASVGSGILLTGAAASVLKVIPGFGTIAGGIALPIVAGASTYALGKVFVDHFENGGGVLDFEAEQAKAFFKRAYAEGEKLAKAAKAKVQEAF